MASYHFSAQVFSRSAGRSAVAGAAYRAGERLDDERTGLTHDYRRRFGVLHSEILLPKGAPEACRDRRTLWNAVEAAEKRVNSQTARELQLAIAHELPPDLRLRTVRDFVLRELVRRHGVAADLNLHAPDKHGDQRNFHAHVMLTTRRLEANGFGAKARDMNERTQLAEWREKWAAYQNRALERIGSKARVDHRSFEAQGIEREPGVHLGTSASAMERRGEPTGRGDTARAIKERNAQRRELAHARNVIDLEIAREERARRERQAKEAERERREREMRAKGRWVGEQLYRFQRWSERQTRDLHRAHAEQAGVLAEAHSEQRREKEAELARFYGSDRAREEYELREIAARQERGGILYRLTGHAKRDRTEAQAHRRTLANIAQREAEQRGALRGRQEAQREHMEAQQRREARELAEAIEAERERQGLSDAQSREQAEAVEARARGGERPRNLLAQIERDRQAGRERGDDREREREPD